MELTFHYNMSHQFYFLSQLNTISFYKNLIFCYGVGVVKFASFTKSCNISFVELLVNKPLLNGAIRMYILMLDTRNVEQTKYVLCTLKNLF